MHKKRSVFRYIVPILIIIISILFFVIMLKSRPAPVQKAADEQAWSVESMLVEKANHKPLLQLYGQTITGLDIQLTSSIEADAIKRHINLGDTVQKGQKLLTLDKSRLEQIRLQRKSEHSELEAMIKNEILQLETDTALLKLETELLKITANGVKRAKTLEKSLMASSAQLDDAYRAEIQQKLSITRLNASIKNHPARLAQLQAKLTQAQTRLVLAEDDISKTEILSPINGVITAVFIDDAEHVRQGAALFSISDSNNLEVQSLIPQSQHEQLSHTFKKSGSVNAKIQTANRTLTATLDRLPDNINKGLAGSYAFFRLNNLEKQLLIGQTVTIFAELEQQKNSIAIPHDAIYGIDSVFIIKEQRLERIQVEWLGETFFDNKKYVLINGEALENKDEILISKFANAMQGLKVKTNNPNANSLIDSGNVGQL